jgi:hypothetical protein
MAEMLGPAKATECFTRTFSTIEASGHVSAIEVLYGGPLNRLNRLRVLEIEIGELVRPDLDSRPEIGGKSLFCHDVISSLE